MQKHLWTFINNKYGLTLIEVLAGLTIATIVIGLAFSVLQNSMNAYKKTESKQLIQQEANLFVTQLRTIHRSQSSYVIAYNSTTNQYTIALSDGEAQALGNPKYKIELAIDNIKITESLALPIDATRNDYHLRIKISDPLTNDDFTLETGLTRL